MSEPVAPAEGHRAGGVAAVNRRLFPARGQSKGIRGGRPARVPKAASAHIKSPTPNTTHLGYARAAWADGGSILLLAFQVVLNTRIASTSGGGRSARRSVKI